MNLTYYCQVYFVIMKKNFESGFVMKFERMLSIITYLLHHEKVKAQDLAEKFEVSVRTIYRDLETLSQAGIPVVTYQGVGGGIGLVEGYKLDKSVFTGDEVLKILAGLKGLQSIMEDVKIKLLIEKFSSAAAQTEYLPAGNEILIDLSSWNKDDQLSLRIRELKQAIYAKMVIEFNYYTNEKLTQRRVEPYVIVFKEANWYLYAYCLLRQDFRFFKLRRMSELELLEINFSMREFSLDKVDWQSESESEKETQIVVVFDPRMKYEVNDTFGIDNYEILADGRLKVVFQMGLSSWLYGFLLGFGDKIEVLEPLELRDKIKRIAMSVCKVYEK